MRGTRGIGKVAQRVARAAVAISIAASSILPAAMPAAAQAGPYAGVELNVLTGVGPQIAEPLARRGKEWAEANGAKVNVVTVPFNEIYSKMLTDVYTRTNAFDIFVFAPQWMGDFAAGGFLEPLDKPLAEHPEIEWSDVGAFFRDFSATYQGTTYTVPLDGDFHMMYYRSDILAKLNLKAPATWDDYNAVAKAISDAIQQDVAASYLALSKSEREEGLGGYAKEMSKEYQAKQAELVSSHIAKQDIVITTALIPGRPAPRLIIDAQVASMKPGSVIVDLAVEQGGNVEGAVAGEVVERHGVKIVGHRNVPSRLAADSSALFARNLYNFLSTFWDKEKNAPVLDEEIGNAIRLTQGGKVVNERLLAS